MSERERVRKGAKRMDRSRGKRSDKARDGKVVCTEGRGGGHRKNRQIRLQYKEYTNIIHIHDGKRVL